MTFSTNMTIEQIKQAHEFQRRADLAQARMWRDHWQKKVEDLEAADPLRRVSTANA